MVTANCEKGMTLRFILKHQDLVALSFKTNCFSLKMKILYIYISYVIVKNKTIKTMYSKPTDKDKATWAKKLDFEKVHNISTGSR